MKTRKQQQGMTFLSWVVVIGFVILIFVTGVRLAPVYAEYFAVKSLMDKIVKDPAITASNTQALRRKLDDYLNVNGMYTIQKEYFSLQNIPERQNKKALVVDYEVRKPWIGNIDFLLTFKHAEELQGQ